MIGPDKNVAICWKSRRGGTISREVVIDPSEIKRRTPFLVIRKDEDMILRVQGNEERNSLSGKFRPA